MGLGFKGSAEVQTLGLRIAGFSDPNPHRLNKFRRRI